MSGGGSGTQTITQEVPEWAKKSYEELFNRALSQSRQDYNPYTAADLKSGLAVADLRIADPNAQLLESERMIMRVADKGIPELGKAQSVTSGLIDDVRKLTTPMDYAAIQRQFTPAEFQAAQASQFQFGPAGQFLGLTPQQYMSPYMQNVVDRQKEAAIDEFRRARGERAAEAVTAGAFGGSRQAVEEGVARGRLGTQLGDIQAQGLQSAYEQASRQFELDRAARMATEQAQAGELGRVQGIGVSEAGRVQAARAAEAARVQQARMDERFRQRQLGLEGTAMQGSLAEQLAGLGEREREDYFRRAGLLGQVGTARTAREQAELDLAYAETMAREGWGRERLGFLSDILRGTPIADAGTRTVSMPGTNPYAQLLGAGIGAFGAYNAYGGYGGYGGPYG